MGDENIWTRVEEYSKEHGGAVATILLHDSWVPLFPVLSKEIENVDALIICTPEYVEHIMKELGTHADYPSK